jgi:hypothetical protein
MEKTHIIAKSMIGILLLVFLWSDPSLHADEKIRLTQKETPKAAFLAFHKALHGKNMIEAKKYISKTYFDLFKGSRFGDEKIISDLSVAVFPKELEIVNVEMIGDKAVISAIGRFRSDKPLRYVKEGGVMVPKYFADRKVTANMSQEEGLWKITSFGWRSM